jgi:hypothetical protein
MAAAITPMPNGHLQTKKARKLACFKFKKLEHMARNCSNPPLGLCHECCKTGGYQLHWSMDFGAPLPKRAQPVKTLGV